MSNIINVNYDVSKDIAHTATLIEGNHSIVADIKVDIRFLHLFGFEFISWWFDASRDIEKLRRRLPGHIHLEKIKIEQLF